MVYQRFVKRVEGQRVGELRLVDGTAIGEGQGGVLEVEGQDVAEEIAVAVKQIVLDDAVEIVGDETALQAIDFFEDVSDFENGQVKDADMAGGLQQAFNGSNSTGIAVEQPVEQDVGIDGAVNVRHVSPGRTGRNRHHWRSQFR